MDKKYIGTRCIAQYMAERLEMVGRIHVKDSERTPDCYSSALRNLPKVYASEMTYRHVLYVDGTSDILAQLA